MCQWLQTAVCTGPARHGTAPILLCIFYQRTKQHNRFGLFSSLSLLLPTSSFQVLLQKLFLKCTQWANMCLSLSKFSLLFTKLQYTSRWLVGWLVGWFICSTFCWPFKNINKSISYCCAVPCKTGARLLSVASSHLRHFLRSSPCNLLLLLLFVFIAFDAGRGTPLLSRWFL